MILIHFIFIIIIIVFGAYACNTNYCTYNVCDFHDFASRIVYPSTVGELQQIVQTNYWLTTRQPYKISIAGQRKSQGNHTMFPGSICIDMINMDQMQINNCYNETATIVVQGGATWKIVQSYLDRYDLSVAEMQSYNNFSVGGSISVNCHGRSLEYGTIADTIEELEVMQADGTIVQLSKVDPLFRGIVGSYGALGIIVSATLKVTQNYAIESKVTYSSIKNWSHTAKDMITNPNLVFFNGNLYPTNENRICNIAWYRTTKIPTNERIHVKKNIYVQKAAEYLVRHMDVFKRLRSEFEPVTLINKVVYRNFEMSYDTDDLEPLMKFKNTSLLQEYFVSLNALSHFVNYLLFLKYKYDINIVNVSLRIVKSTTVPILNYATTDCIAIVLYISIWKFKHEYQRLKMFAKQLIDKVIECKGSYYLPYLPLASISQFQKCYPHYMELVSLKNTFDCRNIFMNQFISKYVMTL